MIKIVQPPSSSSLQFGGVEKNAVHNLLPILNPSSFFAVYYLPTPLHIYNKLVIHARVVNSANSYPNRILHSRLLRLPFSYRTTLLLVTTFILYHKHTPNKVYIGQNSSINSTILKPNLGE